MAEEPASRSGSVLNRAAALALAGLTLLALPQVGATLQQLVLAGRVAWSQPELLTEPLGRPRSGEQALGPMGEAVALLREHGIEAYRYSPGIAGDDLAVQRLIEGAWPIRPRPDARVWVSFLSEPSPCPAFAERKLAGFDRLGVRLARCP